MRRYIYTNIRQSLRPVKDWLNTSSSIIWKDFMSPWGIGPLMRYMSKNEQILTKGRVQQYTLNNPIFCLDYGEYLTYLNIISYAYTGPYFQILRVIYPYVGVQY